MADAKNDKTSIALENRLEVLESRHLFQDDIIEQLNQELAVHQAEIAELKQQLTLMAARLKENSAHQEDESQVEPPPPHF